MRTPIRLATLAAAALLGGGLATPGTAQTLSPISVKATFLGSDAGSACTASLCTISVASLTCEAVGVNSTRVPFAGACDAKIEVVVQTQVVNGVRLCTKARSGKLTMTFLGTQDATLAVDVVLGHGVLKWRGQMSELNGHAYVGATEGQVTPACVSREGVKQNMRGTFSYVRVP